jgi:Glycosyl hydrolase family 76
MWGGMVDFWAYTKDQSFVYSTLQALVAQAGPGNNYIMPQQVFDEVPPIPHFIGLSGEY